MMDPLQPDRFDQGNILQQKQVIYFLTPFNYLFQGLSGEPLGLTGVPPLIWLAGLGSDEPMGYEKLLSAEKFWNS